MTLYAKWTPNTYKVTFNKSSDNASGSMSDQTFTYGVTQALSDNKFTRAGYAFAGWEWENAYGKKITLADEKEVSDLTTENGGTVELNAVWKAIFKTENGVIKGLTAYGKELATIEIPTSIDGEKITEIGATAFEDCSKLTEITIPDSVTSIDYNAFIYCGKLTSIKLPKNLKMIANGLFYRCIGLTEITIPDGVESIGSNSFYGCSKLTSITIPSSVESIGFNAFYDCSKLASISIPSSVETIGKYAFSGCSKLTEITIPSSVTTINESTFAGCSSLVSFKVPTGITKIDDKAFCNCTSLRLVYIPDSVTTICARDIPYSPFYGCDDSLVIYCGCDENSETTSDWGYDWNRNRYSYSTLLVVWNYTGDIFENISLTSDFAYVVEEEDKKEVCLLSYFGDATVEIPSEIEEMPVTKLNRYCFYNNSSITSVTIPNSITSIGYSAFQNCSGLTSITIPSSVTSIGQYAFYGCSSLAEINFNATNCADLTSRSDVFCGAGKNGDGITVTFGEGVTSIPAYLFFDNSNSSSYIPKVTSVSISSSVTSIGEAAFMYCSELTTITFEENCKLENINSSAFMYCSGLKTVTIPKSVTYLRSSAFAYCENLIIIFYCGTEADKANIDIADDAFNLCYATWCYYSKDEPATSGEFWHNVDGVPTLWNQTDIFVTSDSTLTGLTAYGKTLSTITIPSDITSIGSYAFVGCVNMTKIEIPTSVTSIDSYAFRGCSGLTTITIPSSVASIGGYAFYYCSGLTEIIIPNSVATIGSYVFAYCSGLTSIVIPSSVTTIGESAFAECSSLTSVTFEKNSALIRIKEYAFHVCDGLTSIEIPSSVMVIEGDAFRGCAYLETIKFGENSQLTWLGKLSGLISLESIEIPSSVETIVADAFSECMSLKSIVIPISVTSINREAFYHCGNLRNIYYGGTEEDWSKISINSSSNTYPTKATRYYYVENEADVPADGGNYWHYVDGVPTVWQTDAE